MDDLGLLHFTNLVKYTMTQHLSAQVQKSIFSNNDER